MSCSSYKIRTMNPNGSPEDEIHNMDKLFNSVLNHRKCTLNQYININLFFFFKGKTEFILCLMVLERQRL